MDPCAGVARRRVPADVDLCFARPGGNGGGNGMPQSVAWAGLR